MSKERRITLCQEQVRNGDRRWCLYTTCRNSNGEDGQVSMLIDQRFGEERFTFIYSDEGQGPYELILDDNEWKELLELHESHAFDEYGDQGESLIDEEREKILAKVRERFYDKHLNQLMIDGMGLGCESAVKRLKRRWMTITDLIHLQTVC